MLRDSASLNAPAPGVGGRIQAPTFSCLVISYVSGHAPRPLVTVFFTGNEDELATPGAPASE